MKKRIILCSILITFLISTLNSQDWQQFRGPNRDGKVLNFKAPGTWPPGLSLQWKIDVGFGDASPVLIGNLLYLSTRQGDNEVVLCLDSQTGKEIWKDSYAAAAVTGPSASHPGPRGTPAVASGKIITFGATGILSCLNAATGEVFWRKENPTGDVPQFFTGMSPLIVENVCIVHTGTKEKGTVSAFDINTGKPKWTYSSSEGPTYASPSVMTIDNKKHIIVQTETNIIAFDFTDGKPVWKIETPAQQRFYNSTSPYIDGQTIYYTGQGNGTKAIRVTKAGNNYAIKELWSNPEVGAKWNTPVLINGFLYGFSDQRRIYCLNAATGKRAWINNIVNSDFATIVDCGSVIIGLPSPGDLIVFKPNASQYSEVARYKVSDAPVYAFPVVNGNFIYIKDSKTLSMFRIGS